MIRVLVSGKKASQIKYRNDPVKYDLDCTAELVLRYVNNRSPTRTNADDDSPALPKKRLEKQLLQIFDTITS